MTAVLVRNKMDGPTVLTPEFGKAHYIRWEGAGDPDGGDVQLVEAEAVRTVPFVRAVAQDILEVEDEDGEAAEILSGPVAAQLARQRAAAQAARDRARAELEEIVEPASDRDIIGVGCIGPDTRGIGTCGDLVNIPEKEATTRPPLCVRHRMLAGQFVPSEDVDHDGKSFTKWTRVALGAREGTGVPRTARRVQNVAAKGSAPKSSAKGAKGAGK
jgi:hypothetical protein